MGKRVGAGPKSWHRGFLIITGITEIVLELICIIVIVILGYHGFRAGEMGSMVGIFSVAVLIVLLPFAAVRVVAVYGVWKKRRWALIITIILSTIIGAGGVFTIQVSFVFFIIIILYGLFSLWAAIGYLRGL